jgi:transcriptional regulator with XRE-family HTH domain
MPAQQPPLLLVYARNVEHCAFKRGWSASRLASELGVSLNSLNRIRFVRSRYLDPEILEALLEIFGCEPNALLLPQPDIDYSSEALPH